MSIARTNGIDEEISCLRILHRLCGYVEWQSTGIHRLRDLVFYLAAKAHQRPSALVGATSFAHWPRAAAKLGVPNTDDALGLRSPLFWVLYLVMALALRPMRLPLQARSDPLSEPVGQRGATGAA